MQYPNKFFNKTSKDLTIALILASSGIQLDPDEVTFGAASAVDPVPANDDDPNTFIQAKFKPGTNSQYASKGGFLYRRARFSEAGMTDLGYGLVTSYPTTVHKILSIMNQKFGTLVTPADVIDKPIPAPVESIILEANPTSPNFFGKTEMWLVERVLTQPDLDGFLEYKP